MKIFNSIPVRKPKSSVFDLSHEVKLTMNMADLVPIGVHEVIPGDRFKVSNEMLMRLAPMVAPVMHRVDVRQYWFFVPNRILGKIE